MNEYTGQIRVKKSEKLRAELCEDETWYRVTVPRAGRKLKSSVEMDDFVIEVRAAGDIRMPNFARLMPKCAGAVAEALRTAGILATRKVGRAQNEGMGLSRAPASG